MLGENNPRGGIVGGQHANIGSHDTARYRTHTSDHYQEYLRAIHGGQIVLDQDWSFGHAHKDIAGRNQSLRARDLDKLTQKPGERSNNPLDNAPIIQQRD